MSLTITSPFNSGDHEVDDLADLVLGQLREDDEVVHAVEELGPELALELAVDVGLHLLVVHGAARRGLEARGHGLADVLRPQVGDSLL